MIVEDIFSLFVFYDIYTISIKYYNYFINYCEKKYYKE